MLPAQSRLQAAVAAAISAKPLSFPRRARTLSKRSHARHELDWIFDFFVAAAGAVAAEVGRVI